MKNVQIEKKDGSVCVLPEDIAEELIKKKQAKLHAYSGKTEKKQAKPKKDKMIKSAPKTKGRK